MSEENDVPFERADSVTIYLSRDQARARVVLYEFDAEEAERLELGAWEYPSGDWETVLN